MSSIDDLMSQIPVDQIARRLGSDRASVEQAVSAALPALMGGMQANAQDPAGAASLARAIGTKDPSLVEGGVDLDQVDPDDGDKIVRNVFGPNTDGVVSRLGATGGAGGGLVAKVLPLIAPIVMAYLAKRLGGHAGGQGGAPEASGGGLGDLLGGLLGGGSSSGGLGGGLGGIDVGGMLGGLLGGGKR